MIVLRTLLTLILFRQIISIIGLVLVWKWAGQFDWYHPFDTAMSFGKKICFNSFIESALKIILTIRQQRGTTMNRDEGQYQLRFLRISDVTWIKIPRKTMWQLSYSYIYSFIISYSSMFRRWQSPSKRSQEVKVLDQLKELCNYYITTDPDEPIQPYSYICYPLQEPNVGLPELRLTQLTESRLHTVDLLPQTPNNNFIYSTEVVPPGKGCFLTKTVCTF